MSVFCDRLRSFAIVCDPLQSCDHMETKVLRSAIETYPIKRHNIFNSDPRFNSERFNKATERVYHRNGKDFTDKNKKANCWERITEKFNLSAAEA